MEFILICLFYKKVFKFCLSFIASICKMQSNPQTKATPEFARFLPKLNPSKAQIYKVSAKFKPI